MPDASSATNATTETATPALNLNAIRAAFPSLGVEVNGQPVVYFDNPGGTQVPQACIDAITHYLSSANANTGGAFLTSQRTDAVLAEAHAAMADFLNAADPREIVAVFLDGAQHGGASGVCQGRVAFGAAERAEIPEEERHARHAVVEVEPQGRHLTMAFAGHREAQPIDILRSAQRQPLDAVTDATGLRQ